MRCSKNALAVAIAIGSLSSVASAAEGPKEHAQKRPAGHHCWYRGIAKFGPDHWHGSGWYWCGPRPPSERREAGSKRRAWHRRGAKAPATGYPEYYYPPQPYYTYPR